jgi:hypothetical protein
MLVINGFGGMRLKIEMDLQMELEVIGIFTYDPF